MAVKTYIKQAVRADGTCCEDCSRAAPCDPCVCPAPTLLCATASASHTKTGWIDNDFTTQTVKLFYKAITAAGTITRTFVNGCGSGCDQVLSYAHSGTSTYDPSTGITVDGMEVEECLTNGGGAPSCTTYGIPLPIGNNPKTNFFPWSFSAPCQPTQIDTQLTTTVQGPGTGSCSSPSVVVTGSATKTVSDEYTTGDNIDAALAAVGTPGTLASCGSPIIASISISADGTTASVKLGDYAFPIPADAPTCYTITWDRVATPSSGSPTITPMSYTWDGVATQTPTYSEAVPGDNTAEPGYSNAITIENIVVTCTGCA